MRLAQCGLMVWLAVLLTGCFHSAANVHQMILAGAKQEAKGGGSNETAAIAELGTSACPELVASLSSNDQWVRAFSVGCLGFINYPPATPAICALAENDPVEDVQVEALGSLMLRRDPSGEPTLIRLINNSKNDRVVRVAITALGMLKDRTTVSLIADHLQSPSMEVSCFAMIALGDIGGADAASKLEAEGKRLNGAAASKIGKRDLDTRRRNIDYALKKSRKVTP